MKSQISLKEACTVFYKELHNASDSSIEYLKKTFPEEFSKVDTNQAKKLFLFTEIYCGMISASDYFSSERVENIKSLVSFSIAYTEEFYKIMEEISNAHLRWDIPYYKPSPEHPLENIAYYLCQKWGIPNNNAEILKIAGIEAPNTFLVYMVEAALLMSMKCWKFINERYDIIFD